MVVQFTIPVANVTALLALGFTRLEVWRSSDRGNSYQEVTGHVAGPAVLTANTPQTLYDMGGHQLRFSVNGGPERVVSFNTILQYWTATQVAAAINAVVASLASVDGDGALVLTSPTTGRASEIEITYNDASDLGWVSGQTTFGVDARPVLVSNVLSYLYSDVAGQASDLYKWRFSADGVNPISDFSDAINGDTPPVFGNMSVASAQFYGLDGRPQKRTLIIVSDNPNQQLSGAIIGNQDPILVSADDSGFLQVSLAKGALVRVAIEGTAFVREITVPTTDSFDLLAALAAAPDPFTIQSPPPFLTRRSI